MTHSARLVLNKNVRHRILAGHPWVFAGEVDRVDGRPEDGGTVEVRSSRGDSLGSAIYNSRSKIVARRYATELVPLDVRLLSARLDEALAYRESLEKTLPGMARRLVWSESDQLPGLVVDRYDDILILQTLTLAMSRREEIIADLLLRKTGCRVVLARNDAPIRQLEGLPLERKVLHGSYEAPTRVRIAGIAYDLDLWSGQKTGFYLDQAENYAAVAAIAAGAAGAPGRRVLDCFTNQGAFALSARKAGAVSCRAVDQSAEALRHAAATAKAENLQVEWIEADVFDLLRHYEKQRETFDLVILDPPSFTKSKGNKASALRGYHELHLRALRLLTRGGILATFSCSHHVTTGDWDELLQRASSETGATLRVRRRLGQSSDHPVLVNVPETGYLRGYVLEKVNGNAA
ncbi:MAG TPA: class I SAM-dependent rRNA methyltransferase [Candidatus Methylacidiphilales bacterium]|nr:class I SAM-dependent rRNA methyltransferase [Candidatus Methylacidiphilales bacterium]